MPFDPDKLLAMAPIKTTATHAERDVILYALGLGVGSESAVSADTLAFTYEENLQVLPTMAAVLASPGFWARKPEYGIDWKRLLHGEQNLHFHKKLPVSGSMTSVQTIEDIFDKGAEKGAVVYTRREVYETESGDHLVTERRANFLRGDGGKGGRTDSAPALRPSPDRSCDIQITIPTREDQALLYRLSGDYNPLHIDPDFASNANFEKPILHGLCTFGIAGRALLSGLVDNETSRLEALGCRFSAPVYPGETLVTDIWECGGGAAAFQCRALERDVVVLSHGHAQYSARENAAHRE